MWRTYLPSVLRSAKKSVVAEDSSESGYCIVFHESKVTAKASGCVDLLVEDVITPEYFH